MNDLRTAAQQALERLRKYHYGNGFAEDAECIADLEAALAQQAEPVAYTTGHCENHKQKGGCQLHNLQCGWPDCDRKPTTASSQQAEPVEQLAELQAMLRAEVDRLIAAGIQPRRTMVPLTEEEIKTAFHAARNAKLGASQDNSRHRLSVIEIARAVEQASWEKNHGQA